MFQMNMARVLEDDLAWSDTDKYMCQLLLMIIADWSMTNTFFFEPLFLLYCVPESNISNQLNSLYIYSDNLSFSGAYLQNGCIAGGEIEMGYKFFGCADERYNLRGC